MTAMKSVCLKLNKLIKKRVLLFIFCIFYLGFALATYQVFGITWDELSEFNLAELNYAKFFQEDPKLEERFLIYNPQDFVPNMYARPHLVLYYMINDAKSFEIYHLLQLLTGLTIFVVSYELALSYTKQAKYAFLAPVFLFFTPRFLGHIPANPKDVPFAIFYFLSLAAIYFFRQTKPYARADLEKNKQCQIEQVQVQVIWRVLVLGILFGLTQALRMVGLSLYLLDFVFQIKPNLSLKQILCISLESSLIFLIGFLTQIIVHPFLGADPIGHFLILLNNSQNFFWNQKFLFMGQQLLAADRPWYYLPVWLLITTPLVIWLSCLVFYRQLNWHKPLQKLLISSLVLQLILYLIAKPIVYDGLRHFLYWLPQLSLLAVLLLSDFLKKQSTRIKVATILLVVLALGLVAKDYYQLHPYYYVYFNELTGTFKQAANDFETDYWGAASREAVLQLNSYVKNNYQEMISQAQQFQVYTCSEPYQSQYYFADFLRWTEDLTAADFVICNRRYNQHLKVEKAGFRKIEAVERKGVELALVYERGSFDFYKF